MPRDALTGAWPSPNSASRCQGVIERVIVLVREQQQLFRPRRKFEGHGAPQVDPGACVQVMAYAAHVQCGLAAHMKPGDASGKKGNCAL